MKKRKKIMLMLKTVERTPPETKKNGQSTAKKFSPKLEKMDLRFV